MESDEGSDRKGDELSYEGLQRMMELALFGKSFRGFLPQTSEEMRRQIGMQALYNPSLYASLVGPVNAFLKWQQFPLSGHAYDSIMGNLSQVHGGAMTQSGAHLREALHFSLDCILSLHRKEFSRAAVYGIGTALNLLGSVGWPILPLLMTSKSAHGSNTGSDNDFELQPLPGSDKAP
ncbi:hypothetical protein [Archangium gephyra]|nr:hypothetical protein [Archangium gephyra]